MDMPPTESRHDPRVLVYSKRNVIARKWHALQYELEDVGAELGLADIVAPRPSRQTPLDRVYNRINRTLGRGGVMEESTEEVPIQGEYDLFFAFFSFPSDIPNILRLKG